jgi:hypothetical protein
LQRQDGHADVAQEGGDVEAAKPGVQPGVVPAVERSVDIVVIAGETLAQIAGFIRVGDLADAGDVEVFDKEVRGNGDQTEQAGCLSVWGRNRSLRGIAASQRWG